MARLGDRRRRGTRALALTLAPVLAAAWMWPVQMGGRTSYRMTNGNSMEPRFHSGDFVIVRQSTNLLQAC
jgi:hypothetical protein